MDKLMLRINEAAMISGLSRSKIYELGAAGRLNFYKSGKITLINHAELRALLAELPVVPPKVPSILRKRAADARDAAA